MSDSNDIDDRGFVTFRIGGTVKEVDVFAVWNEIVDARQRCADDGRPDAFLGEVVRVLNGAGFPRVSHYAADLLVQRLCAVVADLGKDPEGEPTPGSPSTSEQAS